MREVEESGMRCHVPERKSKGGGSSLYSKESFRYLKARDAYRCPAGKLLPRRYETFKQGKLHYAYTDLRICEGCPIRSKCTKNERGRTVWRREDEYIAERVRKRMEKEPGKYKRRGTTVEKVFGTIKWAMGCESLLMKGLEKCQGEWSLMCACYNMKRAVSILGVERLLEALQGAAFPRKSAHMAGVFAAVLAETSSMPMIRVSKILDANRKQALRALFASAF